MGVGLIMDIVAVGWACPIGLRSAPAYAAVRAGIREIDVADDGQPADMLVSQLSDDDRPSLGVTRAERALFYAGHAVTEILQRIELARDLRVCLAAPDPDEVPSLDVAACWSELRRRGPVLPLDAQIYTAGRAGVFAALLAAAQLLDGGEASQVLVGSFDSIAATDAPRVAAHGRGRIAGEGAAFILLARSGQSRHALVRLGQPVLLRDPASFASGEPSRGEGLTEVFRLLLSSREARVDVVCPANPTGDWWSRELSYAYLRNATRMPEPLKTTTIYEHVGDAGPVNGVAAIVAATRALTPLLPGRFPEHSSALVHASSDSGSVGGCCLQSLTRTS